MNIEKQRRFRIEENDRRRQKFLSRSSRLSRIRVFLNKHNFIKELSFYLESSLRGNTINRAKYYKLKRQVLHTEKYTLAIYNSPNYEDEFTLKDARRSELYAKLSFHRIF